MKRTAPQRDIYQEITDKIVKSLEDGVKPWRQPWSGGHAAGTVSRPLRHNLEPYNGINVLMLWASAMERNFEAPIWMTYKQAKALGGQVRKGEKSSPVVYANKLIREDENPDTGELEEKAIPFLKTYSVFNVEQIDGLPADFYETKTAIENTDARDARAEGFFQNLGADIRHGGGQAYYLPSEDFIQMPDFKRFLSAESYYATLAHESVHWTKGKGRLDRDFGRKRFGDAGYATEELVAELGASFLCADLDLVPAEREESVAYIGNWLKALKGDKKVIFTAAAHASRACDFMHGLQPEPLQALDGENPVHEPG